MERGSRKRGQEKRPTYMEQAWANLNYSAPSPSNILFVFLWVSFLWKTREGKTEIKKSPFSHTGDLSAPVLASKTSDLSRASAMSLDMPLNQHSGLRAQPLAPEAGG